eukprot:scaffold12705_cov106-Isochrysis_galbana.AAC.5
MEFAAARSRAGGVSDHEAALTSESLPASRASHECSSPSIAHSEVGASIFCSPTTDERRRKRRPSRRLNPGRISLKSWSATATSTASTVAP